MENFNSQNIFAIHVTDSDTPDNMDKNQNQNPNPSLDADTNTFIAPYFLNIEEVEDSYDQINNENISKTLIERFYDIVDNNKTTLKKALISYKDDMSVDSVYTWEKYGDQVTRFKNFMLKYGYRNTAIHAFNSPEWFVAALGTIASGSHVAGIYNTNTDSQCMHVIKTGECSVLVVDTYDTLIKHYSKILPNIMLQGIHILVIDGSVEIASEQIKAKTDKMEGDHRAALMYIYDSGMLQNFDFVINSVTNSRKYRDIKYSLEDTITLIFTSGTTSDPKAVSLTNKNILSSVESVLEVIPLNKNNENEILLSYLPLSHIAGQCLDLFSQIYHEGEVHFARPDAMRGSLKKSLQIVRPTVFLGVPRVWEKMKEGIMGAAEKKYKGITGTLLKSVSTSAKNINYSYQQTVDNSNRSYISYFSSYINYPAYYLSSSMTDVVKKELGFDRCKYFVSGAAPISTEVLEYFMSINMPIHEIYGMSETSGIISISDPFSAIDKYCGKPVKNIEVKIDPKTEEILVKGDVVFKSYHNYNGGMEDMFDSEGYFKTGDCGNMNDNDSNGKLKITGRIKELIITAGGENIPPVIIENRIKTEAGTDSQMMVVGDKQKFLTMLVFNPIEERELSEKTIEDAIKIYNNNYAISNSQKIQKFKIVRDALTVESGLLTPTMKMKRSIIAKHYDVVIKEMYSDS